MTRTLKTNSLIRHSLTLALALVVAAATFIPNAAAAAPRKASYAPHIKRHVIPTRSESMGPQVATWYGPGLFGNRTACGSRLQTTTWGIAHRSLPCGTLVNLSLKGRSVTVPVIDRGPFSGATVDLTSRTKSYLGFVSGKVKMSKVKRYRLAVKKGKPSSAKPKKFKPTRTAPATRR